MLEDTLVAWPTHGDGNCSFHALLGVWNGHAFFCEHLAERKKEAADAVRSIFPQHPLFEKVGAAIQQIIFEAINPDRKENFLDLRAVRTEYARRQAAAEQAAWLQLNIELIANQDILDAINLFITGLPLEKRETLITLQTQWGEYLAVEKATLLQQLESRPLLKTAVQAYDAATHTGFDLTPYLSSEVINRYAACLASDGYWLLPLELDLLAHIFGITIVYYSKQDALIQQSDLFNPNQASTVRIAFSPGPPGHYERVASQSDPCFNRGLSTRVGLKTIEEEKKTTAIFTSTPHTNHGLTYWPSPSTIDPLPAAQQGNTYEMSHLLAAGFRGTDYQLLVLLDELIKLLVEEKSFEAMVEVDGVGNLDDLGLVIKKDEKVTDLRTYQIKYYNHPITIYDFFNALDKKEEAKAPDKKNEKMHIGKFLDGWIAWHIKYSCLAQESIIYTNAGLDKVLQSCLTDQGRFREEFLTRKASVLVEKDTSIKQRLPKNFLTHLVLEAGKVSYHFSNKTWEALQEKGFLDQEGCFTEKFQPEIEGFTLGLTKKELPAGVSSLMVQTHLTTLYQAHLDNKVDLYEVLYGQAWEYLRTKKLHPFIAQQPDKGKNLRFQNFLRSFVFYKDRAVIQDLEASIQKNLAIILNDTPTQMYVCLYFAVRTGFGKTALKKKYRSLLIILLNN